MKLLDCLFGLILKPSKTLQFEQQFLTSIEKSDPLIITVMQTGILIYTSFNFFRFTRRKVKFNNVRFSRTFHVTAACFSRDYYFLKYIYSYKKRLLNCRYSNNIANYNVHTYVKELLKCGIRIYNKGVFFRCKTS